jgi:hypothetical protein
MLLAQMLLCFYFGGAVAIALQLLILGKFIDLTIFEMVMSTIIWPAGAVMTYLSRRKFLKHFNESVESAGFPQLTLPHPPREDVELVDLCPACRASFDAVKARIFNCRICTPPPVDRETEH